jgi:hypothetical protein
VVEDARAPDEARRRWLRWELDRRLEIIEELKQKGVDLTHQVAETKAEAEREMQTMERLHQAKWQ